MPLLKLLIASGTDISSNSIIVRAENLTGAESLFMQAIRTDNGSVARTLVHVGCFNVEEAFMYEVQYASTTAHLSSFQCVQRQVQVVSKIFDHVHVNMGWIKNSGETALKHAIKSCEPSLIDVVLQGIKSYVTHARIALSSLAAIPHSKSSGFSLRDAIVNSLLQQCLEARDQQGNTAFMIAADIYQKCVIDKLIQMGANIGALDKNKKKVLFLASIQESRQELIQAGAKEILQPYYTELGETSLVLAVKSGQIERVQKVLQGAQSYWTHIRAALGLTPSGNAGPSRSSKASFQEEIIRTIYHNFLEARDAEGRTALMTAAWTDQKDMIEKLAQAGASIEAPGLKDEETPLILAIKKKKRQAIQALVQAGANLRATDIDGADVRSLAKDYGVEDLLPPAS